MDIFDEILNKTPKEKFLEIIQNANKGALEKVLDDFIAEHISMIELLEKQGLGEDDIDHFKKANSVFVEERKNDIFIGLGARILGQEG